MQRKVGAPFPKFVLALLVSCLVATGTGCAQLLVGGLIALQSILPVSDEQEVLMGRESARQLILQPGVRVYTQPEVNAYVQGVGKALAAKSRRPNLPWTFIIVDSPDKNAFTMPGGYIFITTGALRAMENEAQLAAVLAHEIAHVDARHGVDQIKRALLARGILVSALGSSPEAAQVVGQIASTIVLRGYGREAELQADELGASLASKANYDPRQLAAFLRTLARGNDPPGWLGPLATHPSVDERVARLEQVISQQQLKGNKVDRNNFLSATAPLQGGGAGR